MDLIEKGFVDSVHGDAVEVIREDRARYTTVYESIIAFIKRESLIVSDAAKLIGRVDPIAFGFQIYSQSPLEHAKQLTDILAKLSKFVKMRAVTVEEFVIEYDTRVMATLHQIPHKSRAIKDIIMPIELDGVLYMPVELELIDTYRQLTSLEDFAKYEENRAAEQMLFVKLDERLPIIGGASPCEQAKRVEAETLKQVIAEDFLTKYRGYALIGDWACDIYAGRTQPNKEKIQLVIDHPIEQFVDALTQYLDEITNFKLVRREQKLYLLKDFRTTRYTFYVQLPVRGNILEKAVLDVYNCGMFELVPTVTMRNTILGAPFVLCRFFMIDIWIMRLIEQVHGVSSSTMQLFIKRCYSHLITMRTKKVGVEEYIGTFREFAIDKKIRNKMLGHGEESSYYGAP